MNADRLIRVLVVDDHAVVRTGLRYTLAAFPDMELVGEAENGESGIQACEATRPDVVLMDAKMPVMDGVAATRAIRDRFPEVQVIMLTSFSEGATVRDAIQAGATGYLLKDAGAEELVQAIRSACQGRFTLAPAAGRELARALSAPPEPPAYTPKTLRLTKLYRPPLPSDYIPRPQLIQLLQQNAERPLILVSAPAGYGKTTLLSAWLEKNDCCFGWLSLDEDDNHFELFLAYLLYAIRNLFPSACQDTFDLLAAPAMPPLTVIFNLLLYEIGNIPQDFTLVLDDFHVIQNKAILNLLTTMLRQPAFRIHLVLAARQEPALPLNTLRAQNLLAEIRGRDLRFTEQEGAAFLQKTAAIALDEQDLALMEANNAGWPAGLRMITLARSGWDAGSQPDLAELADNQHALQYLLDEVLINQSVAVQEFLLKTSILEQMCESLCAAVVKSEPAAQDSQPTLQMLEKQNLFVEILDGRGQWMRYHPLFRELLQRRLQESFPPAEIAALHQRASAWLAQHELAEEALKHALLSGDRRVAVGVVAQFSYVLMNREEWHMLERWLNKFPPERIQSEPELLLTSTWIHWAHWQLAKAYSDIDRVKAILEQNPPTPEDGRRFQVSIDTLTSIRCNYSSQFQQAIFHAQRALQQAPQSWYMLRSVAWLHLGVALQCSVGLKQGIEAIQEGAHEDLNDPEHPAVRVQISACILYLNAADLPNLIRTASFSLATAQKSRLPDSESWIHYFLGSGYYCQNDLARAEQHFRLVFDHRYSAHANCAVQCAIGLALICEAQGRVEEAIQFVDQAEQFLHDTGYSMLQSTVDALRAALAVMQGDLQTANKWLESTDPGLPLQAMPHLFDPQMIPPLVLIAQNTSDSLQQAAGILLRQRDYLAAIHNIHYKIKALALLAIVYDLQGNEQASQQALNEAIGLARPVRFVRFFIDHGRQLAGPLTRLQASGYAAAFIEGILQAIPAARQAPRATAGAAAGGREIIAPLTERETEILELLGQRLSNKEIAGRLVISDLTVKRHAINIYQKLNVKNRREAVARGLALGILRPR